VNDPKKWPWLVAVHSNFSVTKNGENMEIGPFQCSGSIIHEEYLLTAAHCVKKIVCLLNI
jgi:secreted trypsin-like serine protease